MTIVTNVDCPLLLINRDVSTSSTRVIVPQWVTDARGFPMMHFEYIPQTGEKWVFESITAYSAPVFTHNYPFGFGFQQYDDETDLYCQNAGEFSDPHLSISL